MAPNKIICNITASDEGNFTKSSSLQNNNTVLLFHAAITTSTSRAWLHKARLNYFGVLHLCSGNITINISWLNKRNLFLQASQNGSKTFWIVTFLFVFYFLFFVYTSCILYLSAHLLLLFRRTIKLSSS